MNKYKMFFVLQIISIIALFFSSRAFTIDNDTKIYQAKNTKGGYDIYADNPAVIPYTVNLNFPSLNNVKPSANVPLIVVLPARSVSNFLVELVPLGNAAYSFRSSAEFSPGDAYHAKHDDSFLYWFPFENGKKHRIDQGYNGKATHFGSSAYALDFNMIIGTPVTAARDGVVFEIKSDSDIGGPSSSYEPYANHIEVYHDDGSIGSYVHLEKNGVIVHIGDRVKAGQIIGYSGNTGYSSGPHLHFAVSMPGTNGVNQSIPTKYLNYDGKALEPREGEYYYSYHPGEPQFRAVFGKDIQESEYSNYSAGATNNNTFTIRTEKNDDTSILFGDNGFDYTNEIILTCKQNNMIASRNNPIDAFIPPRSEIFLFLLKPADSKELFNYELNYMTYNPSGDTLNDNDFASYSKPIAQTGSAKVRVEESGSTSVFYIQNGYNFPINLKLSCTLLNLKASKPLPLEMVVPPLTEKYLFLMRPVNKGDTIRYSYSMSVQEAE